MAQSLTWTATESQVGVLFQAVLEVQWIQNAAIGDWRTEPAAVVDLMSILVWLEVSICGIGPYIAYRVSSVGVLSCL